LENNKGSDILNLSDIYQQTSLIIETNNLQGGIGGKAELINSLQRLLTSMAEQTVQLDALGQVIVTHDGLNPQDISKIKNIASCELNFVEVPKGCGYYQAKNIGFEAILPTVEYVVFADSDCKPDRNWLLELLHPFQKNADLQAVAGRTSYHCSAFGTGLTTIDFYYYPHPNHPGMTRNFYANNIALRRNLFEKYTYRNLNRTYRGHCQSIGIKMEDDGVQILFARKAHTVHRLPDTVREVLKLRWMRGQDTCSLTPFLVKKHLPSWMQWFAKTGPIAPLLVLFIRLGISLKALNHQDLPSVKGIKWLHAVGAIFAVSAIDMTGALFRGLDVYTHSNADRDQVSLSYHK